MVITKSKINWDDLRQQADAYLLDHAAITERFRLALRPLFDAMWAKTKKPVLRRPNISLRLIADGDPLAKLIVLPYWLDYRKEVDCERLYCELVVEGTVTTKVGEAKKWTRQVTCSADPGTMTSGQIRPSVAEDLRRVIETMDSFLLDKKAVLARSHDHCCACGRCLTDELSRSRGIGPECIQLAEFAVWLTPQSVIQPEAISA